MNENEFNENEFNENEFNENEFNEDEFNEDKFNEDEFNEDKFNEDEFNEDKFLDYLMDNKQEGISEEEINTPWVKKMHECAINKNVFKTTVTVYHLFKKYKIISEANMEKIGKEKYIKGLKLAVLHFELILMQFYQWSNEKIKEFEDKIFELINIPKF